VKGQAPAGALNVLVWLRQDLRLHDNPALVEAIKLANQLGGTVTFLYVHSPGGCRAGGAAGCRAGGAAGAGGLGGWGGGGAGGLRAGGRGMRAP
jgi:hypothetical protein